MFNHSSFNKKVEETRNGPGLAQRVPGSLGSQIPWHSVCEGVEVVGLAHRSPLPPGMFLVFIFSRGWVDPRIMERSEESMSLKNPVTQPRIDTGTVRPVAQRLNHYATPGHLLLIILRGKYQHQSFHIKEFCVSTYSSCKCSVWLPAINIDYCST
jgi:hypothetical protein